MRTRWAVGLLLSSGASASQKRRSPWLRRFPSCSPVGAALGHAKAIRCRLFVEPRDQARRIPAPTAHFLHFGIELVDQGGDRQAGAVLARLVKADREVLAHPVDGEAEIEGAGDHR